MNQSHKSFVIADGILNGTADGDACVRMQKRPAHFGLPLSLCLTGIAALLALLSPFNSFAAFVYETSAEFFTTGDFNGDGIADVLVLDKLTGNARVGLLDTNGVISWSAPLVTGVENATGCAVGKFLQNTLDAVAVTAPDYNRVNLVNLSNTNAAGTPVVVTPNGVGPHCLVTLAAPTVPPPQFNSLVVASSLNDPPSERLEPVSLFLGVPSLSGQFNESGSFQRGNAIQFDTNGPTFAAGLVRGDSDSLHILQFTNSYSLIMTYTNLPSGSDYAFGNFNGSSLPVFAFYVSGQSNVVIQALIQTNGGFSLSAASSVSFTEAVQRVYYTDLGTDGAFQIQFGDGIQGMTLPGGTPTLAPVYTNGTGAAGNVFTGIVPLGSGQFVLLDSPTGVAISTHAQTMKFDGTNYTQLKAQNLPPLTTSATRANVWLFQAEPFVNSNPGFVASLNSADWTSFLTGLPGGVSVRTETDGGPANGLGNANTNNLGAPPTGTTYGVPDQYRDDVSFFSYTAPRAAEPITVNIAPPPGLYGGPIQVSFTTLNAGDLVAYRAGSTDVWHQYTASFTISNDTTVTYYGTNSTPARSRLLSANYTFSQHALAPPQSPVDLNPGNTNPLPVFSTNTLVLSDVGTIFYGRRPATGDGTIWAINLDGTGETYVTTGARPRVSRDGVWLAFLREGNAFANQGNLWVRNLQTGQETRLLVNTTTIVGFDWDLSNSNLIFDFGCALWRIGLDGTATQLATLPCNTEAPVVNPQDGVLALHDLNASAPGIYVAASDGSASAQLPLGITGARWPAWSADGLMLALVDGNTSASVDAGKNIYLASSNGTTVNQISGILDPTNGFPHGMIWAPAGNALIGAGSVSGENGLWVVPLTADKSACDCFGGPTRLPTVAGDPIDFAGSVIVAPAPPPSVFRPGLFIRLDGSDVVVYWSTNYTNFTLQAKTTPTPPTNWVAIYGPYTVNGPFFEHREPAATLAIQRFFRLSSAALQPVLSIVALPDEIVVSWDTAFPSAILESNTAPDSGASWQAISGPFQMAGNSFQYHIPLANLQTQQFFRLRHP